MTTVGSLVAVYKSNLDLIVYVLGTAIQNELVLSSVLETYFDTLVELLK